MVIPLPPAKPADPDREIDRAYLERLKSSSVSAWRHGKLIKGDADNIGDKTYIDQSRPLALMFQPQAVSPGMVDFYTRDTPKNSLKPTLLYSPILVNGIKYYVVEYYSATHDTLYSSSRGDSAFNFDFVLDEGSFQEFHQKQQIGAISHETIRELYRVFFPKNTYFETDEPKIGEGKIDSFTEVHILDETERETIAGLRTVIDAVKNNNLTAFLPFFNNILINTQLNDSIVALCRSNRNLGCSSSTSDELKVIAEYLALFMYPKGSFSEKPDAEKNYWRHPAFQTTFTGNIAKILNRPPRRDIVRLALTNTLLQDPKLQYLNNAAFKAHLEKVLSEDGKIEEKVRDIFAEFIKG